MLVADWVVGCGSSAVSGVADMLVDVAVCCGVVRSWGCCICSWRNRASVLRGSVCRRNVVPLMPVFVARVTVVVAGVAEMVAGVAASCVVVWMSSVLVA